MLNHEFHRSGRLNKYLDFARELKLLVKFIGGTFGKNLLRPTLKKSEKKMKELEIL